MIELRSMAMVTFLKWFILVLLAGLSWLIGVITLEYFKPYRKVSIRVK